MGSGPMMNSMALPGRINFTQKPAATPARPPAQMTADMGLNDPNATLKQAGWAQNGNQWRDPASGIWSDQNAAVAHVQDLKNQNLNPDGSPVRPGFESLLDPKTGLLQNQYQMNVPGIDQNSLAGMSALKGEAIRSGPSQWAQIQLAGQNQDRQNALGQAQGQAGQALAEGRSSLATRGGLSSGARERLATSSMKNLIGATQGVNANALQSKYGLLGQDEQNRLSNLNNYTGQESQLAQYNNANQLKQGEFNLTNTLAENQAKRADKLAKYQAELSKWGAAGTAAGMS